MEEQGKRNVKMVSSDEADQTGTAQQPAGKRRARQPGSLQVSEPVEQPAAAEAGQIGPAEAAPHWQSFYRAVSDAIAAMRPNP